MSRLDSGMFQELTITELISSRRGPPEFREESVVSGFKPRGAKVVDMFSMLCQVHVNSFGPGDTQAGLDEAFSTASYILLLL